MGTNPNPTIPQAARAGGARLTRKKYTFRLPLELASRLEALCEMHPSQTRAQLIGDLLGLGLAEVERARSGSGGAQQAQPPDLNQPIYLLTGPFSEFHHLTYKHHLALEQAQDKKSAALAPPVDEYRLDESE